MTIKEIYELAVKLGKQADFRGPKGISRVLKLEKEKFEELKEEKKALYDKERLTNPFTDTRILVDKPGFKIKKILVGIDIDTAELLLAKQIGDIDLVMSHHPAGKALADLSGVMHLQADVLNLYGVPINIAESLIKERVGEISRRVNPINHNRAVQAAQILGLGYLCVHTPTDNLVASFLKKEIEKEKPEYVREVLEILDKIPEYQEAAKLNAGPRLFAGAPDNRAGKVAMTELTGGTEGSPRMYEKLSNVGIGTIVGMHMSEENKKEAEKAHLNSIVAGHIASDSLGLNLFLDELEKRGIEIIPCAGLIRVKRFKKM